MAILRLSAALLLLAALAARAVVINSEGGNGNTSAPADNPGWENVGVLGTGTGIYLGEGWVLTTPQAGAGAISFSGVSYNASTGSTVQLANNSPGKTPLTGLILFRLDSTPQNLPSLALAASPPAVGAPVTMVGAGRDRGAFTQWTTNQTATPWTWTEVSSGGNAAGYQTLHTRAMRWGTNTVSANNLWAVSHYGSALDVRSFATAFDFNGNPDEAQAVLGDWGGAVFSKNGTAWELAGVMFSSAGYSGQPSPELTPVFGNESFLADISAYAPQILSIVPEPSPLALLAIPAALAILRRHKRGAR